jgi:hypothetical protein
MPWRAATGHALAAADTCAGVFDSGGFAPDEKKPGCPGFSARDPVNRAT